MVYFPQVPQVGFPDWANWLGVVSSVVGVVVSVGGIWIAVWQIVQAKRIAVSARDAAVEAIRELQERNLNVVLGHTITHLSLVREYIQSDDIRAARATFDVCVRDISDLFQNLKLSNLIVEGRPKSDIAIMTKQISNFLDGSATSAGRKAAAVSALRAVSDRLVAEEARRKRSA